MKQLFLILALAFAAALNSQNAYENAKYGFSVTVPADWHVYAEIKDDAENHFAILDWGLPKVYSKLEKQDIENAISITAYRRADIKSMDELVKFEFDRVSEILQSKTKLDDKENVSYEETTIRNGHTYKTKVTFVFKNNVGYVLNFTATPGTYDKNLDKFNSFVSSVVFSAPKESTAPASSASASSAIRFDGLYVAKTGSVNAGGTVLEIYNYIRFYSNGEVYTQSVSSYAPEKVSKWMGRDGRFERSGKYTVNGTEIKFTVNNDKSPDKAIEGPLTDSYNGKVTDGNKLFLQFTYGSGPAKDAWFEFVKSE